MKPELLNFLIMTLVPTDAWIFQVADLIAFVASARSFDEEGSGDDYIDSFGSHCLSVFRTLGLPSTAVLIRVRNLFTSFL